MRSYVGRGSDRDGMERRSATGLGLDDRLLAGLKRIHESDGVLELLTRADDLLFVLPYLERVPLERVIINHLAGPAFKSPYLEVWCEAMERAAACPGVHVKLSGMITQTKREDLPRLKEAVADAAAWFGPDRLLFGSDWPVALAGGSYRAVLDLFESVLPPAWTDAERELVRRENARRIYQV